MLQLGRASRSFAKTGFLSQCAYAKAAALLLWEVNGKREARGHHALASAWEAEVKIFAIPGSGWGSARERGGARREWVGSGERAKRSEKGAGS